MTASGLVTTDSSTDDNNHVLAVVEFAFAIRSQLQVVNVHSFNNFQLRIGPLRYVCYSLYLRWRDQRASYAYVAPRPMVIHDVSYRASYKS